MSQRNDVTVKLDAELVKNARVIAAFRELSLAEYLSEALRPIVQRDFRKEILERSGDLPAVDADPDAKRV